jgi:hypothetical protein
MHISSVNKAYLTYLPLSLLNLNVLGKVHLTSLFQRVVPTYEPKTQTRGYHTAEASAKPALAHCHVLAYWLDPIMSVTCKGGDVLKNFQTAAWKTQRGCLRDRLTSKLIPEYLHESALNLVVCAPEGKQEILSSDLWPLQLLNDLTASTPLCAKTMNHRLTMPDRSSTGPLACSGTLSCGVAAAGNKGTQSHCTLLLSRALC